MQALKAMFWELDLCCNLKVYIQYTLETITFIKY